MTERTVLVIDADPGAAERLRRSIPHARVVLVDDLREARAMLPAVQPDVVVLDLEPAPDAAPSASLRLLEHIGRVLPGTRVITTSAGGDEATALRALAEGADDVHHKPVPGDALTFAVERALRLAALEARLRPPPTRPAWHGLITGCARTQNALAELERLAATDAAVLIRGESGTGKRLAARALHASSRRAAGPVVVVDGASCSDERLEGLLADAGRSAPSEDGAGPRSAVAGGTLVLDGIGDLSLPAQARLLHHLDGCCRAPVDADSDLPPDVRVVATSEHDLQALVAAGRFRADLQVRLAAISVGLPPLRERRGDVILLARGLVAWHGGPRKLRLSPGCVAAMEAWAWPGNVRELESRVQRACAVAEGRLITSRHMDLVDDDEAPMNLKEVRARAERREILRALDRCDENVSQAARLLGISRPTLYNLFAKHGLMSGAGR